MGDDTTPSVACRPPASAPRRSGLAAPPRNPSAPDWSVRPTSSGTGAPRVAAERAGAYRPDGQDPDDAVDGRRASGAVAATLDDLTAVLDRMGDLSFDGLAAGELESLLGRIQRELGRLTAIRATVTSRWQDQARAAAGRGREGQVERETQQLLRDQLNLPPGEAKRTVKAGQKANTPGPLADGFRDGRLSEAHLTVITDIGRGLPPDVRQRLESELTDAAQRLDPVALGRLARRRLAELEPEAARRSEQRRHARRRLSIAATDDGGVRIFGQLYGLQAEKAMTAFHAFHSYDAPGQRRSSEHRGADAFEALCDVALRSGEAATQHGQRPHVQVLLPWETLVTQSGVAELGYTGPVSFDELRPLLSDAVIGRVVLDGDGVPIEVSKQVRTVPAGLWRALVARDGGCTWEGCDAPAGWCEAAHGDVPYRLEGRLRLDNAALLCGRHHRRFDAGGWTMVIDGASVSYRRVVTGSRQSDVRQSQQSLSAGIDPPVGAGRPGGGPAPPAPPAPSGPDVPRDPPGSPGPRRSAGSPGSAGSPRPPGSPNSPRPPTVPGVQLGFDDAPG